MGLEDIIAKRLGRGGFGFRQTSENSQVNGGLLSQVKPEDLEAFGLIPELIGRLPVIAPLDALAVEDLVRILQTPKNSSVQQFRKLVKFHGADLVFTKNALKEIARVALQRATGARGLRAVVEEVVEGVLFDLEAGVRFVISTTWILPRSGRASRPDSASEIRQSIKARLSELISSIVVEILADGSRRWCKAEITLTTGTKRWILMGSNRGVLVNGKRVWGFWHKPANSLAEWHALLKKDLR